MPHTKVCSAIHGLMLMPMAIATPAWAVTYYVDDNANCTTADGTAAKPFCTIQAGVNKAAASGDTVQVAAGSYYEDVNINAKSLKLLGADPDNTFISGFNDGVYVHGFTSSALVGQVEIANFNISVAANAGVRFEASDQAYLSGSVHNCILTLNRTGIYVKKAKVRASNNVIALSTVHGAYVESSATLFFSNIIVDNLTGIYCYISEMSSFYNDYNGNTTNRYNRYGCDPFTTQGDLDNTDPMFISNTGYHVQADSPTINAGSPADKDPDGSRADQGAYGA